MGSITRSFANNIGSSGILTASAVTNATVEDVTSFDNAANPATLVLLSTQTASSSANISFTTGLDSTYDEYIFKFINMHPATDAVAFQFNMSTDGGSNYNVTKTTTSIKVEHDEADTGTALTYAASFDLAQSTAFQPLGESVGNGNDDFAVESFVAGYGNTTSAVNAIQFKFDTGNIDAGTIYMYGIK